MEKRARRRLWLLGLAGAMLLALLTGPSTRWLARTQFGYLFPFVQTPASPDSFHAIADRHPDDFSLQLAYALSQTGNEEASEDDTRYGTRMARNLEPLLERFSDRPALYATLLRYKTASDIRMVREEEYLLSGEAFPKEKAEQKASSPEALVAFDAEAAQGEKLDPENAYFPYMRAWGLFAAYRDDEALEAVRRAGTKSRWDDYALIETEGRWHLEEASYGEISTLQRAMIWAANLYPHFASMRQVGRLVAYKAIEAEQAGRSEEGLALRQALMRYGSLMRVQAKSLIGNLVGVALVAIGTSRPGGAPLLKRDPNNHTPAEQRARERTEKYLTYLRHLGKEDKARWAQAELESGPRVKEAIRPASEEDIYLGSLMRLGTWWGVDLLVLSNLPGLLFLGGAAGLAAKCRPKKGTKALRIVFGLLVAIGLIWWQAYWLHEVSRTFGQMVGTPTLDSESAKTDIPDIFGLSLMIALTLAIPLLTLLCLSIVSRICRVPLSTGIGHGLRRLTVPLACLVLLVYGGLLFATARQEVQASAELIRQSQHEGRFLAERSGNTWPEPVR